MLVVIAGTILLADNRKNLRHLSELLFGPPPEVTAQSRPPAPSVEPNTTISPLLSIPTTGTKPLTRLSDAETRCAAIARAEQEAPAYVETPKFSQCTFLFVDNSTQPSPSVFIQIQADQAGMLSSFRLKLNTEGGMHAAIVEEGLSALRSFGGFYLETGEIIPLLATRINEWKEFQIVLGPYLIEMDREVLDPTRFNIFGRLHTTDAESGNLWRDEQSSTFRN